MKYAAFVLALFLTGCSDSPSNLPFGESRSMIVCTLDSKAFVMRKHLGDTVFATRQPEADPLCRPANRATP